MLLQQKNRCHQTGLCHILKIPFSWKAHATELSNLLFPPSCFHTKKTDCSNLTCNIWCTKKNGSHSNPIDQFYKLFCRAHKFAYAENAPLANNRISNVWIMASQCYKKKDASMFFFSIAPNQPAWPQICAADHRGLNVVTIYFKFFLTRFVGKHCPLLSRVLFFSFFWTNIQMIL